MSAISTQHLLELAISQEYKHWPVATFDNEFLEYNQHVKHVLDQLELQLLHNKYVVISIDNGNNESTLQHDFILYRNSSSSVLKLEYYMPFYQSCISNGENWRHELATLFSSTTNSERLMVWNNMFSVRERQDNNNSLRIRLHINPNIIRRPMLNNSIVINHKRALSHIKDNNSNIRTTV